MKIYNTLHRKKEDFTPLKAGTVKLYTCGPTVYDCSHIGNLRSFIIADTLARSLAASGLKVSHAMNITDIDDKTITKAKAEHPKDKPIEALLRVTGRYSHQFKEDLTQLGVDIKNITFLNATDHIKDMKKLIIDIFEKGYAYAREDGIYFSVSKYQNEGNDYGALVGEIVKNSAHHRIDNDEYEKAEAADFALWKRSKEGEPGWDLRVDTDTIYGRPGWHIECSAISAHALGQPIDIHTGGVDLIFPHHTNEIAQTRAATNQPLANYFVHSEHLLVDGKKMAKRDNNFYTLSNLAERGYVPNALRLLALQAHYRTQQNFSWASLEGATNLLYALFAWADLKHQLAGDDASQLYKEFVAAMEDDMNTPEALRILSQMTGAPPTQSLLNKLDSYLGLKLSDRADITTEQKRLIELREKARDKKDFAASDELRQKLFTQGIGVEDGQTGTRWYKTKLS